MVDPDNILPISVEELVVSEGGTARDRLGCNDTIGPCAACPIRLDNAPGPGDEVA